MLLRFLLIPLPVAMLLLSLQWLSFAAAELSAFLVAAPAYLLSDRVLPHMFHQDGLDALGIALLGWSSLVLAPWWYPRKDQRKLRNKLMLIFLPLAFVLQAGALAWMVWSCLTDFCC